ncbi:MAG: 23S rRNA (guanosine(2251)-2'-O)-methyltransferase RlmB [Elusimicrobia bacterium]|nr:23S rRNA (guanosine(2251)-2'-O)-methyltransferase RlmB [Elusimicrobiota bacterium]
MSAKPRWVVGRHVVEEALGALGKKLLQVLVYTGDRERHADLIAKLKHAGVKVRFVERHELEKVSGGAPHQGLAAEVFEKKVVGFNEWLGNLTNEERKNCLVVALDEIQDPHNFGAIGRSAVCFGAKAIIHPERRTAPVTQAVLQASAGAIQKIPVYAVGNLAQTLLKMKEAGFWVYGADMDGRPAWEIKFNFPMVLVIGSEGKGMRELVRSYCDELTSVPQSPDGVDSLNASCAASVLLYEAVRQSSLG